MMSSSAFLSKPSVTNNLHGNSWHCDSSSWLNTMINSHHSSWLFCSIQHRCFLLSSNITFILVWDTTCYRLFIFHWPPLSLAFVLTHSLPRLLPSHHCECWAVVCYGLGLSLFLPPLADPLKVTLCSFVAVKLIRWQWQSLSLYLHC